MSWGDDSIGRQTTVRKKVLGSRKKRLLPPIISMSQMTKKMPTSGRQNFFRKAIILNSAHALFLAPIPRSFEIPIGHRLQPDGGERSRRSSSHKHRSNGRSLSVAFDILAASDNDSADRQN